ncbi:MAG: type III-B CRISPR module RAMP protein Cmr6 [Candidatus Sumerlaeaceae bacterium]|nr:type III-B CRISPR module RAMP protein Cmr6 [Candidatus Sumerlaeaceae bacterium]
MANPIESCRDQVSSANLDNASHAGLLLARYVKEAAPKNPSAKEDVIKGAILATKAAVAVYRPAFERYQKSLQAAETKTFCVDGRLIVGLGGENVLETGITLHHTYGVPIIPGTALKGLAAHYCDAVFGWRGEGNNAEGFRKDTKYPPEDRDPKGNENYRKDLSSVGERMGCHYRTLFGATDDGGEVIFHDAWILPESLKTEGTGLVRDVMTPHHGNYYMGQHLGQHPAAPTDFDDPNPVRFLSVAGEFFVAVSVRPGVDSGWAKLAMEILVKALKDWGIGGKTNAGYGRMIAPSVPSGANELREDKLKRLKALIDQQEPKRRRDRHNYIVDMLKQECAGDDAMLTEMKDYLRTLFPKGKDRSQPMREFLAE